MLLISYSFNSLTFLSFSGKVVLTTPNNGKVVGQLQAENDLETVAFSKEPSGYLALGNFVLKLLIIRFNYSQTEEYNSCLIKRLN